MQKFPFVGRKEEMKSLELLLARKLASLVVIKGRRRIGKSRLIEEFAKRKKFLRFEGIAPTRSTTAQAQRVEFARQMHQQLGMGGLDAIKDWGDLWTILAQTIKDQPVVILFDEITWMGSKDPTFLGKLKIIWDQYFQKNRDLILILCGSMSSWIEKNIINSTGFLGRISLKLNLNELSLAECAELLKIVGFKGSAKEKFIALSVTGGIPWYIEQINPSLPAQENIRRLCFEPEGLFVEEFKYIFHDLFGKRLPVCRKIVECLKDGPKSYETIAREIQYTSSGSLSEYLEDLITSGFLERDYVWSLQTGQELKTSQYRLRDNYIRYYLKYISPHVRKIKKGLFKTVSPFRLPGWDGVLGLQFENLVLNNKQLIWEELSLSPEDIVFENPYIQRKNTKQAGCQIDYLIQTRLKNLYICEIKFTGESIGMEIVEELEKKMNALKVPKGFALLPVLIHAGEIRPAVKNSHFFTQIISLDKTQLN